MPEPIRLLLVDAPTLSRRCLAAFLNRRRGLQVVGEAATAAQALAQVCTLQPDVVVVEPEVANDGPRFLAELCQAASAAVLVLTLETGGGTAGRALQVGARGYIQKHCEPEDVVRAIERVHAGELMVGSSAADRLLKDLASNLSSAPSLPELTARERDVLQQVSLGRTNVEIARRLYITEHTVKGHLANILRKLHLENRVQVARYAMQNSLEPPSDVDFAVSASSGIPPVRGG
jgi:DNA-binding NarL/FixJ family response regulator